MTEALKPCPFCGGEPIKLTSDDGFTSIGCLHCNPLWGVMVQAVEEAEAVDMWNNRPGAHCPYAQPTDLTDGCAIIKGQKELRAERTCHVESSLLIEGEYVPDSYYEFEMECGGGFKWDEKEPPRFCPKCGAKVVSE